MDEIVYNRLTESAKKALDEASKEVAEMILEKAYQNASTQNTEDKEISLRNVIDAKEEILYKNKIRDLSNDKRKRRFTLILLGIGSLYMTFGLLYYLQPSLFTWEQGSAIIVIFTGYLIGMLGIYSYLPPKKNKNYILTEKDNAEFEIVRKWQTIEKLGAQLILKDDAVSNGNSRSLNNVLSRLSLELQDKSKDEDLRKLLIARNNIMHGGKEMTQSDIEEMIKTADSIIDEIEILLEKSHTSHMI